MTTALGIANGFISAGGGILFSVATTALSLNTQSHRALARNGDEIWHMEEIGKVKDGAKYRAEYVSAFFIVDPFRKQSRSQGWLIHEERKNIILD